MMYKYETAERLDQIRADYNRLLQTGQRISLQALFNSPGFSLDNYCRPFQPHPESQSIAFLAKTFCEHHGIWLPGAKNYITCNLYLYPDADAERLLVTVKNSCVDFWLNDSMGRDIFPNLSTEKQQAATAMIRRMAALTPALAIYDAQPGIESANLAVLQEMRDHAPGSWFSRFIQLFNHHLSLTHDNGQQQASGEYSVEQYINERNHTSGMYYILAMLEYCTAGFLDWEALEVEGTGTAQLIRQLHELITRFGGLSNDLFSFEKEVIEQGAGANLLMVIACNHPEWSLETIIAHAGGMISNDLRSAIRIIDLLELRIAAIPDEDAGKQLLRRHLDGLERCIQASWLWQVMTGRYKREGTIWLETIPVTPNVPQPLELKRNTIHDGSGRD